MNRIEKNSTIFANQRNRFFELLYDVAKADQRIVVITNDYGCEALDKFGTLKNQYFNVGPSEQLAITLAAGMALEGKKPYVYGLIPFITLRALEQIRVSVCSMNLPVTIVGVGAGLTYDTAGLTHHGTEDFNVMRCLPNLTIANISSLEMAEYYVKYSLEQDTPLYLRLDKQSGSCNIFPSGNGFFYWRTPSYNHPIVVTTGILSSYLKEKLSLDYGIVEIYQYPCNEEQFKKVLMKLSWNGVLKIISIEEGYLVGGLGDYLLSMGLDVTKIGFKNFCSENKREDMYKILLGELDEFN